MRGSLVDLQDSSANLDWTIFRLAEKTLLQVVPDRCREGRGDEVRDEQKADG